MRESKVEKDHVTRIDQRGGKSYKFKSPMRRSVPDRLDLMGMRSAANQVQLLAMACGIEMSRVACDKWARRIVGQSVQFTECKAPGKKPRPDQVREHNRLRALGYVVHVVDA